MPLEIILESPKKINFREYQDRQPADDEVLVQTIVSGIKSGTEINLYRGLAPFVKELWDPELRLFRFPETNEKLEPFFPHSLGSWAAGKVIAVGPQVKHFTVNDLVHGEWKHRQTAILRENTLYPVKNSSLLETMLFTDPARFALVAVHDASIKLGDRVAVFGMGAIGLLAIQMARLNGAEMVIAVDPIPGRLEIAKKLGADAIVNPKEVDAGRAIKEMTGKKGADVALEISGVYDALQHALRCVQQGGLVVAASYYGTQSGRVDLSREWHHNRITLLSSMPVWDCPHRDYPLWDMTRIERQVISLLENQRLGVKPMVGLHLPFEQAAKGYALIDENPEGQVKIVLTYIEKEP